MKLRFVVTLGYVIATSSVSHAQIGQTPLERSEFKKTTSHEQMLQYLQELKTASSRFTIEDVGKSVQGRSIPMVHIVPTGSKTKTKVLLFCQQHGNEPSGKEAALLLLKKIAGGEEEAILSQIDLTIIPCVNPDGNEAGKRANANGEDLNRNHLLLTQPEVLAVHSVFNRLKPEVTLDVHEYSAYRKEFTTAGYVRSADEQFGAPTNLNISPAIREYALNVLFPFLETRLKERGVTFSNYLKMNAPTDTVRPSTTSVDDGRQSFAILNRFSFILEGKGGRGMNDELQRRAMGQLAAVESFLEFVNSRSSEIKAMVDAEVNSISLLRSPVIVRMDYLYKGEKMDLPVTDLKTGRDFTLPVAIAPVVTQLDSVERPQAYVIPQASAKILAFLQRHGVHYKAVTKLKKQSVQKYSIVDTQLSWMENKPTWIVTSRMEKAEMTLGKGDAIVRLNQEYGTMLSIALEPSSMWGLVQEDEYSALRTKGSEYPIYRIARQPGSRQ